MRRSVLYIAIAAVQAAGSIGVPLVAARRIGPDALGIVAVGMLVNTAMRAIASLGIYGPVSVELYKGPAGVARARRLLAWSGWVCIPLAVVFLLAALPAREWGQPYLFAASAGISSAVALGHQALHRSLVNHPAYALAMLGPTALAALMGLVAVFALGAGASGYLGAMAITSLVLVLLLHLRHCFADGVASWAEVRGALRMGLPLVLTAAATVGLSLGDRPLVQAFLGSATDGRYHLAYVVAGGGIPLLAALNNVWLPTILNVDPADRMAVLARSTRWVAFGMLPVAAATAIAAPSAIRLVGGASYVNSGTAVLAAVIAASVIPYAVYSGMCIGLLSTEETGSIALATVSGVGLNLGLDLVLIPTLGLPGAGLGSVLGYSAAALIGWKGLGWAPAVPWIRPRLIASTGLAILIVACTTWIPISGIEATVGRLAAGGLVGVLGCLIVAHASSAKIVRGEDSSLLERV